LPLGGEIKGCKKSGGLILRNCMSSRKKYEGTVGQKPSFSSSFIPVWGLSYRVKVQLKTSAEIF
jgi:hypothetical protein